MKSDKINRKFPAREQGRKQALIVLMLAVIFVLVNIAESELLGTYYSSWLYGAAMLAYVLYISAKMRSVALAIFGTIVATAQWHYLLANNYSTIFNDRSFSLHIGIMGISAIVIMPYIFLTKKIKKAYHNRILEISGHMAMDENEGYSSRPRPAGDTKHTVSEIIAFANWCSRKSIGNAIINEDNVIITITDSMIEDRHIDPSGETGPSYIAIDFNGSISVHISKHDYSMYTRKYSYEQVCSSLGAIFSQFLDMYAEGRAKDILIKLRPKRDFFMMFAAMIGLLVLVLIISIWMLVKYGGIGA